MNASLYSISVKKEAKRATSFVLIAAAVLLVSFQALAA